MLDRLCSSPLLDPQTRQKDPKQCPRKTITFTEPYTYSTTPPSQVLVEIGHSLPLPNLLTLPDQNQQRNPSHNVDGRKSPPSHVEAGIRPEWQRVKPNRERKDLTEQVDDGRHLCRLRLVTVRAVSISQGRACLYTDTGDRHTNGKTDPRGLIRDAHAMDYQTGWQQQAEEAEV